MKKRIGKLSLHRETLRHLQSGVLRVARGGTGNTNEIDTGCACTESCVSVCDNCSVTCNAACGTGSCNCTREIVTTCVCC